MGEGQDGWPEACFERFEPLEGSVESREVLQAYQEGYTRGREDALQEMEGRLLPLETLLQRALRECASLRAMLLQALEREVVELVVEMAEKVVGQELQIAPEAILAVVRATLEKAVDQDDLVLRVHPRDYEILTSRVEFHRELEKIPGLRLIRDPGITPGGCLLEIGSGFIDARLESRLAEARKALLGEENGD